MRTFVELVERYVDPELCPYPEYKGKPYYSIKYIENGEEYVGYSTYNLQVMSGFLKKYFMSSAMEKQEQDRWIPVTERPPENKKKVLVSYDTEDGKKVDISMFDKYGCLLGLVSAWRPIPEPYTEDEA